MRQVPPRLHIYLLTIIVLACLWLAGCIATQGYVDERDDAVYERVTKAAVKSARPVDDVIPGASDFVEATYNDEPMREPPAGGGFPWDLIIGGAVAVLTGVPASVGITNHMRDARRRRLNEATNMSEAMEKGYYAPPTAKVPPHEMEGSVEV